MISIYIDTGDINPPTSTNIIIIIALLQNLFRICCKFLEPIIPPQMGLFHRTCDRFSNPLHFLNFETEALELNPSLMVLFNRK